ncbi:MAG: Lrp/AsnC family transcriptional regulator [Nanoarchaeota archaeon]|nr:Lrp/AsnC family transcriptional regulator [DPANN group archaeon]MBL7116746.1 Lrp/AsnC family transcriptional regulator [Nanoarchaeota archaeon]
MDKKDMVFLAHLRNNARETLTFISRKTGIPISTLYDRLKAQEHDIITKHTALIDFSKLGYMCKANITIKVNIEDRDTVKDYLLCQNNVNSLFKINNGYDFLIEGIFKHVKDMEDFMEKFEKKFKVLDKSVYYIIEDVKREAFMSDPEVVNILQKQDS